MNYYYSGKRNIKGYMHLPSTPINISNFNESTSISRRSEAREIRKECSTKAKEWLSEFLIQFLGYSKEEVENDSEVKHILDGLYQYVLNK